ncbi:MAG: hypothetical protein KQJ78_23045 [Deltaproteobacteria bacterium]|nr:hypothetical protein [Deltaproteobacteria bacterium]
MDIKTIFLTEAAVLVTIALVMAYLRITRHTYPGFGYWTTAVACLTVGCDLVALRSVLPDWLSIFVGNSLVGCSFILLLHGLRLFCGRPANLLRETAPFLALFLVFNYFWLATPSLIGRITLMSTVMVFYLGWGAIVAWRGFPVVMGSRDILSVGGMLGLALIGLTRPVMLLAGAEGSHDLLRGGVSEQIFHLVSFLSYLTLCVALIKVNSQRLEYDLGQTRGTLSTLQGLLPMCSNCKNIRDEEDHWHSVESYLRTRSAAQVTLGLCPDCGREISPDSTGGAPAPRKRLDPPAPGARMAPLPG